MTVLLSVARCVLTVWLALCLCGASKSDEEPKYDVDVPQLSVDKALNMLAQQTGAQLLFEFDLAATRHANRVSGRYTLTGALDILLRDTGLSSGLTDKGVITISPVVLAEDRSEFEGGEMKENKKAGLGAFLATVFGLGAGTVLPEQATAQENDTAVEEIVVTGARGRPRTVADSPVPIDVFSAAAISAVPAADINDLLTTLIPSYTVNRRSNSDGSTSVRTPALRGLPGNKTLMLVNSRRRHRTAVVPNNSYGSQAADSALIPKLALKSIEVLRDGAAAQYGSDAIAGVINFILKDSPSGGEINVRSGQYYAGDGFDYSIAGNIGLPLTERGFLNLSAEYVDMDWTHRGTQFHNPSFDAVSYAAANPDYAAAVDLSQPLQRTGQPELSAFRSFFNAGYDLSGSTELYAFGNYASSETFAHGGYRYPANGQAVNDHPIRLANGEEFRFKEILPGGFRPQYTGVIEDYSLVVGTRFEAADISYDLGASYGTDDFKFRLEGVPNPSLGPDTPFSFSPGGTVSEELAFNFDAMTEVLDSLFYSPITLNFGLEYRDEKFKITEGDPGSYAAGPWAIPDPFGFCNADHTPSADAPSAAGLNCANYLDGLTDGFAGRDPVYNVLDVGSAGIPGTPPEYTGNFSRENYSAYVEGTVDITDRMFLDIAGRFEDYSDFGDRFSGKVAMLYKISDGLNVRGSFGTGFRAPSVGQIYLTNVRVTFIDGEATTIGTFPAEHPAASFLGATALRPETSENVSLGFTASFPNGIDLTVDAYKIDIEDTIYMTPRIPVTDSIREQLVVADVPGALTITSMRFFQNAFDSTTSGIDVVTSYQADWNNGSSTQFSAAFNANKYEIKDVHIPGLFDVVAIQNFENAMPDWRGALTANHRIGALSVLGRLIVTGPFEYQRTSSPFPIQQYDIESMLALEVSYGFDNGYAVSVGARNVADNFPDRDDIGSVTNGAIYRDGPISYQGGYYYMNVMKVF